MKERNDDKRIILETFCIGSMSDLVIIQVLVLPHPFCFHIYVPVLSNKNSCLRDSLLSCPSVVLFTVSGFFDNGCKDIAN